MRTARTIAADDAPTVWVRRQWDDYRKAAYRLADLSGFHKSDVSGGIGKAANRPYWHAYVYCDAMIEGELAHSCQHGKGPHRIKVCLVKKDNAAVWSDVLQAAEATPHREGVMAKAADSRQNLIALSHGIAASMVLLNVQSKAKLFRDRGFKDRTVGALVNCAIDAPERLLFMKDDAIRKIPGIGRAGLDEIKRYRERYLLARE